MFMYILKLNEELRPTFYPLDNASLRFAVFADASVASSKDKTSQLGFIVCLDEKFNKAIIVHYSSFNVKRVTRGVLEAALFAVVHANDIASKFQTTISSMMEIRLPMTFYTDSKSLYDALTGIKQPLKNDC